MTFTMANLLRLSIRGTLFVENVLGRLNHSI